MITRHSNALILAGKMTSVELLADALRFFLLYTLLPNGAIAVSLEDAAIIGECVSLCPCVCMCMCVCVCLSVYLCVRLPVSLSLSLCQSIYTSSCVSVSLPVCVSLFLSVCLSIYLSLCPSSDCFTAFKPSDPIRSFN